MADIAVVHLVRHENGPAPLERFIDSYRRHPAGLEHVLFIVFKGFPGNRPLPAYQERLAGIAHGRLFVPDSGMDINAYAAAAESLGNASLCFLNSYSRILYAGWLAKLHGVFAQPGVGLVGATGSSQSVAGGYTGRERSVAALPPLGRFPARVARAVAGGWRRGTLPTDLKFFLLRMAGRWRPARDFPPFPNYHVRTNAFLVARQTWHSLRIAGAMDKIAAYKFESGHDSLTSQVRGLGLRVLVAGRDGQGYEPERWHASNTFWQGAQENLLVADNQSQFYEMSDPALRAELSELAWGRDARPA